MYNQGARESCVGKAISLKIDGFLGNQTYSELHKLHTAIEIES